MWPFKKKEPKPLFRVEEIITNGYTQYYVQQYNFTDDYYINIEIPTKNKKLAIEMCESAIKKHYDSMVVKRSIVFP
jgi:hypothetical protein